MDHLLASEKPLLVPVESIASHGRRRGTLQLLVTALVGDALVTYVALAAASWLRFGSRLADWGTGARFVRWTDYLGYVTVGTLLLCIICVNFQAYTIPRMLRLRALAATLVKSACVWLVSSVALAYLLHLDRPVSRLFIGLAFALVVASLLAWRYLFHKVALKAAVHGRLRQRVLFVNWSRQAGALVDGLVSDRQHLYEIVGCVRAGPDGYKLAPPARMRRLGESRHLPALLRRHEVDMVIVAGLDPSDGEMLDLAALCEKEMVEFKVIPSCFETLVSGLYLESVRGVPVLGLSHLPLDNPINSALKQVLDVAGALVGLVLSAPLIAICGILIYCESPGPIFYRQLRLGRDGTPFWLYKLRSMRPDAEGDGRVGWTRPGDPRRLRIGAFLRRWNIDETPQFWNVLKGEMSLVGPRPERPELIRNFKESIPHYNARHNIKPGLTGWAQVNGYRGDTDLTERVRHDLHYIENWNLVFDLRILLQTLLRQKNAC